MGKEYQAFRRALGKVPWLTSKGLDFARFPLDDVLKQAVKRDDQQLTGALGVLQAMHQAGRDEAGIFLLGLLAYSGDDWKRRAKIVQRLKGFDTQACLDFLVAELRRVKSSNTTRGYITAILEVMEDMPLELVQPALLDLVTDSRFSPRMRNRFTQILHRKSDWW